jgi:hypothetical protein
VSISTHDTARLSWTALGVRMGFTSEPPQREQILAAIERMNWIESSTQPHYLDSAAVGPTVRAVLGRRRQLRMVGVAQLNGAQQLIGLEDRLGTRSYVLDLDSEAICVLDESSRTTPSTPTSPEARTATSDLVKETAT